MVHLNANASPASSTSLGPRTFIRPGIPLTKDDLHEVKRNIAREPWTSAFETLKRDPLSQLGRKMNGPFDTVCRTPDTNLRPWKQDMDAVYKLARTVAAVRGTSMVDRAVENGETYYYVVSAMNSAGESPNSLEDSVTPRSP